MTVCWSDSKIFLNNIYLTFNEGIGQGRLMLGILPGV